MVLGTGIDEDVMRRAGIEKADAFVAVSNGDDNTNAMAAEIAKLVFKVPRVVARLYDPVREIRTIRSVDGGRLPHGDGIGKNS